MLCRYTYDDDGNLIREYSSTDNSLTSYQYTVENRLEAVYTGAVLNSKYELIEYVNDVNREYAEVLVEQNINGRTDTTYTYGVDRISKELFNQTSCTSYYL